MKNKESERDVFLPHLLSFRKIPSMFYNCAIETFFIFNLKLSVPLYLT